MTIKTILRLLIILVFVASSLVTLALAAAAQSGSSPWTQPVNVSRSGGASQIAFATSPDGTLHALWWDAQDGAQYAHTTDISATVWMRATTIPDIFGKLTEDPETKRISRTEPRGIRLVSNAAGDVLSFWHDADNQLLSATVRDGSWGTVESLAQSILASTIVSGSDAVHVVAARIADTESEPAGLYYLANRANRWSQPQLVHASPYFRAMQPNTVHLSVAGNTQDQLLVAWDDPQLGRSEYARSTDGGSTWSVPQIIGSTQGGVTQKVHVAATSTDELLMLWQEPGAGGCGYVQSRSRDGGTTWSNPEKVLSGLTRCEESFTFAIDAKGRLWAIGRSQNAAETNISRLSLTSWDGEHWSDPVDVTLTFFDGETNRTLTLNCLNVAVAAETAGISGCDVNSDVWAARNAMALDNLTTHLQPIWSSVTHLSEGPVSSLTHEVPALATDPQGDFFALWSQDQAGVLGTTQLFGTVWDGLSWSRPVRLMRLDAETPVSHHAAQPALSIDDQGRAHAVWNTGTNGDILYSWTYVRDFVSPQAWTQPVALPAPDRLTSWPDIVADPRGGPVYVAYAIPINEHRGIYVARSLDSGSKWLTPTLAFDAAAAQWTGVDKPRLTLDSQANVLHLVWLRPVPDGGVGAQAIYYARSTDQGNAWSTPLKVAEGNVDWPRVAVPGAQQVYIVWNEIAGGGQVDPVTPMKVRGQFSPDGGQRWAAATDIRGFEQVSGPTSLIGAGDGQMYLAAVGQAVGNESRLITAQWNGQNWDLREELPLRQPAAVNNSVAIASAPAGGRLQALLRTHMLSQSAQEGFGLSASGRQIDAAPLIPAPTFTPLPTATPGPTATPSPTPRPTISPDAQLPSTGNGGPNPLIVGAILAGLIVAGVSAVAIWQKRR